MSTVSTSPQQSFESPVEQQLSELLIAVRTKKPLVHNITNYLAMNISANALLALGASPIMAHSREEASELCRISQALVINIRTLSSGWAEAMVDTAMTARAHNIPWVLDPDGADISSYRMDTCQELAGLSPKVIRGNLKEIAALCADCEPELTPAQMAKADLDQLLPAILSCASRRSSVLCISGLTDNIHLVTDGERVLKVANGDALSSQVAAMGCTASALVGAFLTVTDDAWLATAAAIALLGVACELAASQAKGPGSFQAELMDQLYLIQSDQLAARLRLL
ncbi:hydroxyethylthiazole kinase [Pelagibaculum spongiae]|nr:hydroxyethylthiazole kinase [Pelagibaculum spongiae]